MTFHYLKLLPKEHIGKFDKLLSERERNMISQKIVKNTSDYIFIEEEICFTDSSVSLNISEYNTGVDSTRKELNALIDFHSKLKPVQELSYEKKYGRVHDRWCMPIKGFKNGIITGLKSTYRIQTMIDRNKRVVKVSVQYAPSKVKIKTYYVGGGKC
jgi:hypothetical protein